MVGGFDLALLFHRAQNTTSAIINAWCNKIITLYLNDLSALCFIGPLVGSLL